MKLKKFFYKKINSTNDIAVKKIRKGFSRGLVFAMEQTKGRGQYGKKWISLKGNLFLSVFIEIKNQITLKKITFINYQIIKKILSKLFKTKLTIKFPNDLLINKKKVCGILQETMNNNDKKFIIIGIGINLIKNPNFKNYPTTNLVELLKKKVSKNKIQKQIKKIFETQLTKLYE